MWELRTDLLATFQVIMNKLPRDLINIGQVVLQLKFQSIKMKDEPCIRVNTRELDRVSSTGLSTLYTLDY